MKKKGIISGVLVLFLIVLIVVVVCVFDKEEKLQLKQSMSSNDLNVAMNKDGTPIYISNKFTNVIVKNEETALKAIEDIKKVMGITDKVSDILYLKESYKIGDVTYYEMQQKYSQMDVLGAEINLSVDRNGNVLGMNSSFIPEIRVSTFGLKEENEIKSKINEKYGDNLTYYKFENAVYVDENNKCYIVYLADIVSNKGMWEVLVDGKTLEIIEEEELVDYGQYFYTGLGLDKKEHTITLYEEEKQEKKYYNFFDENRNIVIGSGIGILNGIEDIAHDEQVLETNLALLKFSLGKVKPIQVTMKENNLYYKGSNKAISLELVQNSILALKNYSDIYDYYYKVLGRNSYDNKGGRINVSVMVADDDLSFKYYNAAWVGLFKEIHVGFDNNDNSYVLSKDVLAHEFTHGVVSQTSKFKSTKDKLAPNETGSLNEGYSDVLGSLIEGKNWTIAEDNVVVRDLVNPESLKYPSKKGGEYYLPSLKGRTIEQFLKDNKIEDLRCDGCDNGFEHANATVVGHAAYLMEKNGAFKNKEEMAKVWYNSLFLLSSYSDFEDASYAIIQSAVNLGISGDKIDIIKNALYETKMLADDFFDLSGIVTNNKDKLKDVQVFAVHEKNAHVKFETYTNENGEYVFEDLPNGNYVIIFDKAKYEIKEEKLQINEDVKNFDVELEKIKEEDYDDSQVVFVMDISASMFESDPTDVRKRIMVNILSSMGKKSEAALVIFAKGANTVNSGLSNKVINKKILMTDVFNISNDNGQTPNSGTNGKAGLKKAINLFDEEEKSRKYIVFFTDGMDNVRDEMTYDKLISKAKKRDIRILVIGLGKDVDSTNLSKIASETNGKYYYADSSTDLYNFDYKIFSELE